MKVPDAVRRTLDASPLVQFYKDLPRDLCRLGQSSLRKNLRPARVRLNPDEDRVVRDLHERGYALVEDYWPRDRALEVGRKLSNRVNVPDNQELECGATIRTRFRSRPDCGIRRIYDVEKLLPALLTLRFNPFCEKTATSFYGVPFKSQLLVYQLDSLTGATDGDWHFDTLYPEMKALLLLQDVDATCGPTAYIKGSHRFGAMRLRHALFGYRRGRSARFFSSADVDPWHEREVLLCGTAGTLILFDGRGLHRPTAQCGSPRSFLMNYLVRA